MSVTLEDLAAQLSLISQDLAQVKREHSEVQETVSKLQSDSVTGNISRPDSEHSRPQETAGDNVSTSTASAHVQAALSAAATVAQRGNPPEFNDIPVSPSRVQPTAGGIADNLSPIQELAPLDAAEIQRDFEIIRDSLQRVRLPNNLRVFDSKSGIKKDCQPTLYVISRCARYTETAIKQLSVILNAQESGQHITSDQLRTLFTVLQAQTSFLQGEYASLIVKSSFDNNTAALFKCLEGNSGSFNERSMSNLRRAAEITGAANRAQQGNRSQASTSSYRGRPRGPGRYRDWSYQPHFGSRDVYQNLASRNVPPRRSGGQSNQQGDLQDDQ